MTAFALTAPGAPLPVRSTGRPTHSYSDAPAPNLGGGRYRLLGVPRRGPNVTEPGTADPGPVETSDGVSTVAASPR